MNLSIDIGNTLTKMAVIDKGQVVDIYKIEKLNIEFVQSVLKSYPKIDSAIMITCKDVNDNKESIDYLRSTLSTFIDFNSSITVPITNLYKSPLTLGCDRLAAAIGAKAIYPNNNVLIFDFGTAITIDFVSAENEYIGGNISPGISMRLNALNYYTENLPLVAFDEDFNLIGTHTEQAVLNGVINGIIFEIEGYISRFDEKYTDLRIIFTGGNGNFFANQVKNPIFATYNLVVFGLNRILEYNAE